MSNPTPLDLGEAIRRIKERDHTDAREGAGMTYEDEQALISMLKAGWLIAGLLPDGRIAFGRGPEYRDFPG